MYVPESDVTSCSIGDVPDWGFACVDELVRTLLSSENPFPCTFAVAATKKSALRFGFIESAANSDFWSSLPDILNEYLRVYKDIGKDTSLVVFFRPDDKSVPIDEYFSRCWSVLQYLHEKDARPWPDDVPTDPGEAWWEFSFGGTPIFAVCNTPAHVQRKSRGSTGMLITFKPRWVFEGLEPHTPRGEAARRVIRNRIRRFDGMEPAPQLGGYGDDDNLEWRQYFLPDSNDQEIEGCPFHAQRTRKQNAEDE